MASMPVGTARADRAATLEPARQVMCTASVIVVAYNGKSYLDRCLRSLFADHQPGYEIILVDNASTDGGVDHVEQAYPQVRVARLQENRGYGSGCNAGAQLADGKYLAFLNQDTAVEPGWLEALITALEENPRAGLATSKVLLWSDSERINTCGNDVHCTGLTLCRGMGMDRRAFLVQEEVAAVSGAAFAVRSDLFRELGGFDEAFFLYMEDTDLSWRARLAGYGCVYVPRSVVYHDYVLHFGPQQTFYQERNRYLTLLKHLRWGTLGALAPALLLGEMVTWGFVVVRERRRWTNKLRAYGWIARHWRRIMEGRRQAQGMRKITDRVLIAPFVHRLAYEQTGQGLLAHLSHVTFDPLFLVLRWFTLALVRW